MKRLDAYSYESMFFDRYVPGDFSFFLAEAGDFHLPRRKSVSHKYTYGRALIIAGSSGYSGAPVLAANACERSGAGLTQLLVPECIYSIAASRCDGAVVKPFPASEEGCFSEEACSLILPYLEKADAIAIGPGIGTGPSSVQLLAAVLQAAACPLLLDADAVTICGNHPDLLTLCRVPVVLTPHEGEFRRIGGDLSHGRLAGVVDFMKNRYNTVLVLKGFGTLICSETSIAVNPTGSPALAKGGSGDVLSGILCGLLAQGFDPFFSAQCAVYLHGKAGDLACAEFGEYSVAPSDLLTFLPKAFMTIL